MKKLIALFSIAAVTLPASAESRWLGDVNGDYEVNETDVALLAKMLIQETPLPQDLTLLDVNKDRQITLADLTDLIDLVKALKENKAQKEYLPETVDLGGRGGFD